MKVPSGERNPRVPVHVRSARRLCVSTVVVALLLAVSGCQSNTWSQMPHSMGCELYTDSPRQTLVDPPRPIQVVQVRLSHLRAQRLEVSIEFAEPPQTAAFNYIFTLGHDEDDDNFVRINSPILDLGWTASGGDTGDILESVTVKGRFVDIVLDFKGSEELLGKGPFRPTLWSVNVGLLDYNNVSYPGQRCDWDTPVKVQAPAQSQGRTGSITPDSNLQWRFRSPTGDIRCDLNGTTGLGYAECEVRNHSYQPQFSRDCPASWVNSLTLKQGSPVAFSCSPGSRFPDGLPQQGYGYPLTVGSITCVLDRESGVRCDDKTTGHYFQLSMYAYEWR